MIQDVSFFGVDNDFKLKFSIWLSWKWPSEKFEMNNLKWFGMIQNDNLIATASVLTHQFEAVELS